MIMKWIDGIADRLIALFSALLFAQLPAFFLQYMGQLSGHVHELNLQIQALHLAATTGGKSLPEYVNKFISHADPDFTSQGEIMQAMLHRQEELSHSLLAMQDAGVFTRPFVFLANINTEIATSAFHDFHFAFPVTVEGLIYSLVGLFVGAGLYQGSKKLLARIA